MTHPGPVPNQFPARPPSTVRIALVGESPGADELRLGYPFAGAAGWTLNTTLSSVGLCREECFVGNVSQHRPSPTCNDFALLDWTGDEVQAGIAQLLSDLRTFAPYLVVCLGNVPLHLFRHGNVAPTKTPKSGYKWPSKVSAWRGSLFLAHESLYAQSNLKPEFVADESDARLAGVVKGSGPVDSTSKAQGGLCVSTLAGSVQGPLEGVGRSMDRACIPPSLPALLLEPSSNKSPYSQADASCKGRLGRGSQASTLVRVQAAPFKCLSTYHPAFINRSWSSLFDLRMDLRRARDEGATPTLHLPRLNIAWGPVVEAMDVPIPVTEPMSAPETSNP